MSLVDLVIGLVSPRRDINVYCQNCGEELTLRGGFVADGLIYCFNYKDSIISCLTLGLRPIEGSFRYPDEVQKDIRKGILSWYGNFLDDLTTECLDS